MNGLGVYDPVLHWTQLRLCPCLRESLLQTCLVVCDQPRLFFEKEKRSAVQYETGQNWDAHASLDAHGRNPCPRSRSTSCDAGVSPSAPWAHGSSRSEATTAGGARQERAPPPENVVSGQLSQEGLCFQGTSSSHFTQHHQACPGVSADEFPATLLPCISWFSSPWLRPQQLLERGWCQRPLGRRKHQVEVPHVGGHSTTPADATCHSPEPIPFSPELLRVRTLHGGGPKESSGRPTPASTHSQGKGWRRCNKVMGNSCASNLVILHVGRNKRVPYQHLNHLGNAWAATAPGLILVPDMILRFSMPLRA